MNLRRLPRWMINLLSKMRNPYVTNEHFVPLKGLEIEPYVATHNKTGLHHLLRYYWAIKVLADEERPLSVLDIGCGAGYGSFLIASQLPHVVVTGADFDSRSVRKAATEYSASNLSFIVGDMVTWEKTIGRQKYDVIVSFDTLEHISHREIALENIVMHLNTDGKLLLSTPCGHEELLVTPPWPHHEIEYSYSSLYRFLRRYFETIQGADMDLFPHHEVFDVLVQAQVPYANRMNPVLCSAPIPVVTPYDKKPDLIPQG
jgi:2-polyprenyl-3-methyl-5-hydroxy-6-metoxy-1,4-benzoquinol methylase